MLYDYKELNLENLIEECTIDEEHLTIIFSDKFLQGIKEYAESELPNDYFLKHLKEPYSDPFCEKKYWRGFAMVLVQRGLPKIEDVKNDLLLWFQDINMLGSKEIYEFVKQNISDFIIPIKSVLLQAYNNNDDQWFYRLFQVWYECDSSMDLETKKFIEDNLNEGYGESSIIDLMKSKYNQFIKII